jgi:tricorn protease-like protein
MYIHFDYHAQRNLFAIKQQMPDDTLAIILYDAQSRQVLDRITHTGCPLAPCFSPDGRYLAFFSTINPIFVCDCAIEDIH